MWPCSLYSHPRYMAPEVLTPGPILPTNGDTPTTPLPPKTTNLSSGPKGDVWSLGMVILELCLGQTLWPVATLPQILAKVMLLGKHGAQKHPLDTILDEHGGRQKLDVRTLSWVFQRAEDTLIYMYTLQLSIQITLNGYICFVLNTMFITLMKLWQFLFLKLYVIEIHAH